MSKSKGKKTDKTTKVTKATKGRKVSELVEEVPLILSAPMATRKQNDTVNPNSANASSPNVNCTSSSNEEQQGFITVATCLATMEEIGDDENPEDEIEEYVETSMNRAHRFDDKGTGKKRISKKFGIPLRNPFTKGQVKEWIANSTKSTGPKGKTFAKKRNPLLQHVQVDVNDLNEDTYKPATENWYDICARHWEHFFIEMFENDSTFNDGAPFPIKLESLFEYNLYLIQECGVAFSSMVSYGYTGLHYLQIHQIKVGFGPFRKEMKRFYRAIRRHFHVNIEKSDPILDEDYTKLRAQDQTEFRSCQFVALLMQIYGRGLRMDTLGHVRLGQITWETIQVRGKFICLSTDMYLEKDKVTENEGRDQTLQGSPDVRQCPNIALLLYLTKFRKCFKDNNIINLLQKGDSYEGWNIVPEMVNSYAFVQNDGVTHLNNSDFLNELLAVAKQLDSNGKSLKSHITPRSFRCGLCCRLIVSQKLIRGVVSLEMVKQDIAEYIGWRNVNMVDVYNRAHTEVINTLSIQADTGNIGLADEIAKARAEKKGFVVEWINRIDFESIPAVNDLKYTDLFQSIPVDPEKAEWKMVVPKSLVFYLREMYKTWDKRIDEEKLKSQQEIQQWMQKQLKKGISTETSKKKIPSALRYKGRAQEKMCKQYYKMHKKETKKAFGSCSLEKCKTYVISRWSESILIDHCEKNNRKIVRTPKGNIKHIIDDEVQKRLPKQDITENYGQLYGIDGAKQLVALDQEMKSAFKQLHQEYQRRKGEIERQFQNRRRVMKHSFLKAHSTNKDEEEEETDFDEHDEQSHVHSNDEQNGINEQDDEQTDEQGDEEEQDDETRVSSNSVYNDEWDKYQIDDTTDEEDDEEEVYEWENDVDDIVIVEEFVDDSNEMETDDEEEEEEAFIYISDDDDEEPENKKRK